MKQVLVLWKDAEGAPRAYALGPADDVDGVREEARYHRDAYHLERACMDGLGVELVEEVVDLA